MVKKTTNEWMQTYTDLNRLQITSASVRNVIISVTISINLLK